MPPIEMAMTKALREVRDTIRRLPGLAALAEQPAEAHNDWPAADVYAQSGEWRKGSAFGGGRGAGWSTRHGQQTIAVDISTVRGDLAEATIDLEPFLDGVPDALIRRWRKDRFAGEVQELVAVRWTQDAGEYGSDTVLLLHFLVDVELADDVPEEG